MSSQFFKAIVIASVTVELRIVKAGGDCHLTRAHTRPPLRSAAAGIPISVKVLQNFELVSYFADKDDCVL